eukprot:6278670-Amphidinium_carterae.1
MTLNRLGQLDKPSLPAYQGQPSMWPKLTPHWAQGSRLSYADVLGSSTNVSERQPDAASG